MIQIQDFHFKYIGRKAEAIAGVDLHIQQGETVLLLGPSGSGKSTLALALNGLIPHIVGGRMEGQVDIDGLDNRTATVAELSQKVGILFQDPEAQFVTMTVEDEIAFGLENLQVPPEEMDSRIQEALDQVGIGHYRRRRVDALSGGEKQRLALAAVLAMRPQTLVFDEPTANLDPLGTRQVFETIAKLKANGKFTLIIIEHKLDDLMHMIDRVIALTSEGNILVDGIPAYVFGEQTEDLLAEGVWMPQTALLAHQLRNRGLELSPFPTTLAQAEQAFGALGLAITPNGHKPLPKPDNGHPPAVEVRNLSFQYGEIPVLKNINLQVPKGDFLAIIGANGAGKTTLAQHLIETLHPPAGCVLLNGIDVTQIESRDLIRRVGYVFQNPEHQFITNFVDHEVAFGLRQMGLPEDEIDERMTRLLTQFGLEKLAKANPFTLSHGEKRRLSVATMLAVGQETLILDEPTFGQDQRNATALMELLQELHAAGRTVIIITHDMTLVAEYAHHCAVMSAGELLFHGSTEDVFTQPDLLSRARLTLPPLAELSGRLAARQPEWAGMQTVDHFATALAREMLWEEVT